MVVAHPVVYEFRGRGGHDDLCNAAAGALVLAASKKGPMKISAAVLARAGQPDRYPSYMRFGGGRW
jgi:hypothetical protein